MTQELLIRGESVSSLTREELEEWLLWAIKEIERYNTPEAMKIRSLGRVAALRKEAQ